MGGRVGTPAEQGRQGEAGTAGDGRGRRAGVSESVEYALVIMVAATVAGVAVTWAQHGAVVALLDGVLNHVRSLFGIA